MGIIVLYDDKNEKIGSIYPRRAKQLVLRGQAAWIAEGESVKMNADFSPFSKVSKISKEEKLMTDVKTNGVPKVAEFEPFERDIPPTEPTEPPLSAPDNPDNLIYEQAKKNLQAKTALLKLVALTIGLWLLMPVLHDGVFSNMAHPSTHNADSIRSNLQSFEFALLVWRNLEMIHPDEFEQFGYSVDISRQNLDEIMRNYTPPMFYVLIGALLAWTAFVATQIAKYAKNRWNILRSAKRQNLLMKEYSRLKQVAFED
ncbi:MAG: hypothetical protein FWG68_00960 [Defluviitaleaceae bacterium]|nr:hypothetical protein [Defluviitaleaceae bacterium]